MHSAARSLWRQPLLSPFLWGDWHFLPVFVFQLCNQSYASHGWDFLLGATILNSKGPS